MSYMFANDLEDFYIIPTHEIEEMSCISYSSFQELLAANVAYSSPVLIFVRSFLCINLSQSRQMRLARVTKYD